MSVVAPDEPEGYRGRRRHFRFPFIRRAGGAAVPALLVAASIVVVLIVVGVSQLLPKQAAGQIPFGNAAPGTVSDDNGQGNQPNGDGGTGGNPTSPGGKSAKPGKSGTAKPSGSGTASDPGAPNDGGGGPTPSDPGPGQSQSPTPTPTFTTMTVQAESATLAGGAYSSTTGCTSCLGGAKVRNVGHTSPTVNGSVTVQVTAPAAGSFKLTVSYELSGTRDLYIDVNGVASKFTVSGTSWGAPASISVTVSVKAGTNSLKFYNATAAAPDLDAVKIEQA